MEIIDASINFFMAPWHSFCFYKVCFHGDRKTISNRGSETKMYIHLYLISACSLFWQHYMSAFPFFEHKRPSLGKLSPDLHLMWLHSGTTAKSSVFSPDRWSYDKPEQRTASASKCEHNHWVEWNCIWCKLGVRQPKWNRHQNTNNHTVFKTLFFPPQSSSLRIFLH